ncbi:DNA-processing protein DprA [Pseudomonadota bacterium]
MSIHLITRSSGEYPELLREIPCPPEKLYRTGAPLTAYNKYVSIVGTRLPSTYGLKMAGAISESVARGGGVIVSGLAFGIDAECHKAAVRLGRPTVAIIASGLHNITPASNYGLAQQILAAGGTLLSEYGREEPSKKYQYLARNRIISGMSKGTIVVEARERSGALITADHAIKQNRDVYALLGDVTRAQAYGCNHLISQGATPVYDIPELMRRLKLAYSTRGPLQLSLKQQKIISLLEEPLSFDEILQKCNFNICDLQTLLTELELAQVVSRNIHSKFEIMH